MGRIASDHRSALLVLYNPQHEILLQHRDSHAKRYPNLWGFFGGLIEKGESAEEAVRREIQEELLLNLSTVDFLREYAIQEPGGIFNRFMFVAPTTLSTDTLRKNQLEGDGLGFFTWEDIAALPHNQYVDPIIDDFFTYIRTHG